jgi:LPS O-antigen subunit length determinant protein (WzzB/FepE family)
MEEEDIKEIELIDLLKVLWKWKGLIILGTFVCMVVGGVVSLRMPKIYEVSMSIEPGIIGLGKDGKFIYLDSQNNIKEKIKRDLYNRRIHKVLNINPLKTDVNFKVKSKKGTNFIKVNSEWEENKVELGKKAFVHLLAFVSEEYEYIIEQRKDAYERRILIKKNQIKEVRTQRKDMNKQILIKLNKIEAKKNDITLNGANLRLIRERQKELLKDIKDVKDNAEKIIRERNNVMQYKGNVNDISLLLYSTTIQQNIAYFNQLSTQINDLKKQEKNLDSNIKKLGKEIININIEIERVKLRRTEGLQAKIDNLKVQIDRLNLEKGIIGNIRVIQDPEVSIRPVKPKKRLIVLLVGIVSFFFLVFLAFFVEYIRNAQKATE